MTFAELTDRWRCIRIQLLTSQSRAGVVSDEGSAFRRHQKCALVSASIVGLAMFGFLESLVVCLLR